MNLVEQTRAFFADDGPLARDIGEGYVARPSQVEMAVAVAQAITDREHLFVEAPTGTGKSYAYGVPAALYASGGDISRMAGISPDDVVDVTPMRRVVIATANIALQEQLIHKDLPALRRMLRPFTVAIAKGVGNYLCVSALRKDPVTRAYEIDEVVGTDPELAHQAPQLAAWAEQTSTGDVGELPFSPDYRLWRHYSTSSDDCKGSKGCSYAKQCHVLHARAMVKQAHIVVTNYNLLCLDLAYGRHVLGEYDLLICDEAHRFAHVARDTYGASFGAKRIAKIAELVEHRQENLVQDVGRRTHVFFDRLEQYARSDAYDGVSLERANICKGHEDLCMSLELLLGELQKVSNELLVEIQDARDDGVGEEGLRSKHAQLRKLHRSGTWLHKYIFTIRAAMALNRRYVYSINVNDDRPVKLEARLLDPGHILDETLFCRDAHTTVVATSATLAANASMDFQLRQLGCAAARELVVASPFDYERQARLVVPNTMPDPKNDGYASAVSQHVFDVLERVDGKILCLFTSRKRLNMTYGLLQANPDLLYGRELLAQGSGANRTLMKRFKAHDRAVLLGTLSFWEGFDAPGMRAVVIDRVPFPMMSDPVHKTLSRRDGFGDYSLPQAIITLKQGFGRLIRRTTDHGSIVILDRRLLSAKYGSDIISALPKAPLDTSLDVLGEPTPRVLA